MSRAAWLCVAVAFAAPAFADSLLGLKPGLWEVKPVKTVIDGVDNSAQISQAMANMQAQMASMPPEQRAKMEAMMQQHGVTMNQSGVIGQVCMTQDMVNRKSVPVGKDGKCEPSYTQGGATTSFTYNCQNNGVTSSGKGSITHTGDLLSIVSDGTNTAASGTHTTHFEMQMRYLGADCGNIKPAGSAN